ncbi:hypothetical protein LEMLEM_LOCUS12837, partial [Lemmus lemmus]
MSTAQLLYLRLRDSSGRGDGKRAGLHQQGYTQELSPTRLPKQDLEKDGTNGHAVIEGEVPWGLSPQQERLTMKEDGSRTNSLPQGSAPI